MDNWSSCTLCSYLPSLRRGVLEQTKMTLTEDQKAQKEADKQTLQDIKKYGEARFITMMVNYMDSSVKTRRKGLHVSNLVYPSLRKGYFEYLDQLNNNGRTNSAGMTEESLITLFMGQKFHEESLTPNHELGMEYKIIGGPLVYGTLDDMIMTRSRIVIFDKKTMKTTGSHPLPDYPNEHHRTQIEYYAVMLKAAKFIVSCKDCNKSWLSNFKPEACSWCNKLEALSQGKAPSCEGREIGRASCRER